MSNSAVSLLPNSFGFINKSCPLSNTLYFTKLACDELVPIVRALYELSHELFEVKDDASAFTIADGVVQEILFTNLFKKGKVFKGVVCEEDRTTINITEPPYSVSTLAVPQNLESMICSCRQAVNAIASKLYEIVPPSTLRDCTVFIDPIDGTREFSSKLGLHCTTLVGLAIDSKPVAGLAYRPLSSPTTWALGCNREGVVDGCLDLEHRLATTMTPVNIHGLITTSRSVTPFLRTLINFIPGLTQKEGNDESTRESGDFHVRAGGCGNKVLNLLEGKALCYIQDRGLSRWDTCAAQAIIESRGGVMGKLSTFLSTGDIESYHYEMSEVNPDFESNFTVWKTCRNSVKFAREGDPEIVQNARELKPYANVQGILAMTRCEAFEMKRLRNICIQAARCSPPEFN